jgi:hypothetical protein
MNEQNMEFFMNAEADDGELPAWKLLDTVCRKWAVISGLEKDLSDYQKMKEMYQ